MGVKPWPGWPRHVKKQRLSVHRAAGAGYGLIEIPALTLTMIPALCTAPFPKRRTAYLQCCFPIRLVHPPLPGGWLQYPQRGCCHPFCIIPPCGSTVIKQDAFSHCRINVAIAMACVEIGRILLPFVQYGTFGGGFGLFFSLFLFSTFNTWSAKCLLNINTIQWSL